MQNYKAEEHLIIRKREKFEQLINDNKQVK